MRLCMDGGEGSGRSSEVESPAGAALVRCRLQGNRYCRTVTVLKLVLSMRKTLPKVDGKVWVSDR
jgi:hypothetical protein